jgi:hypothetical protein
MMLAKLLVIYLLCTPFCVSTISPFLNRAMQEYRTLNCAVSSGFLSTLILKSPPYRQTLSLILQEQCKALQTHQSAKKSTSTTSFVFIVVSKFDLSKYCIIYSKILICVIAFYSPSLQGY